MNLKSWVQLMGIIGAVSVFSAQAELEEVQCRQAAPDFLSAGDDTSGLHYAPSREINIRHLALDITPDFKAQSIEGRASLRFQPIAKPFQELRLDGIDLTVHGVTSTEKIMGWQATAKEVIVTFEQPIPPDHEASVSISYHAHPRRGLFFRTPDMGYKPGDMHLWTQCEAEMARDWFPNFDSPNQKFTSEITCRVPPGMVVLSNGKLISEEKDSSSGLVAVRWLQDKPHVSYLMFLAAGYFKKVEDRYKDIPLAFYTPASEIDLATNSFNGTRDMMAFFEHEIGVPYPWAKYDQVCLNDFSAGGMENTSITALNDNTLHPAGFEELRDSQGLIAHELAHQWFGDLVTCKDWPNLWLNEGFATYYEHLYDGYKDGPDTLRLRLYQDSKSIVSHSATNAIVRRNYKRADDLFDYLPYGKGAWVLHMLRSQLGPDLYRQCIKTYLERYQYKNADTEDLKEIIEELSGRSFDQFFDQWVYHAGQPDLAIAYSWDERAKLAKLSIQQKQALSSDVMLFNFPLPIRFQMKNSGPVDRSVTVKKKSEDFYFPLPEAPELVRIDPELTLLAKIDFTPPSAMLYAQLASTNDAIGRTIAVEKLSGKKEALAKLKEALNKDPFYGVRVAASRALRALQTDEALEALLASQKQSDARVRRQVVADITGFYREKVCQFALTCLRAEKNPDIRATAIAGLAPYSKPEIGEQLTALMHTASFRNVLGTAAIGAMRAQGNPVYLDPLRETLRTNQAAFTLSGLGRALDALAWLGRNEEKKDAARELLARFLNDKRERVRLAAIRALGTLGDPKAIGILETFTSLPRESRERAAAEKAVTDLRDARKPSADLSALRTEVLNLQRENRDLRKEMDDLKKKFEAVTKPAAEKRR